MTLLFLHGAACNARVFDAQLGAFASASAPTLPGHAGAPSPHTIEEFARWTEDLVRDRELEDVVLCGHSMGAAIGLWVALRRNVDLRALVLLGGGARLRVAPALFESFERDFERAAQHLAQLFFADASEFAVAWATEMMLTVGKEQTVADFRACDAFDVLSRLEEITVPVLAITGEHDGMTPPKYAQAVADRVSGAQARIIEGAGHFVMVERPEETNGLIRAFLTSPQPV